MLDKILVLLSLIAFIAFLSVVLGFVAEPDLIIVTSLMVALACHDFWISVFRPREHSEPAPPSTVNLEALPTAVSGKPATRRKPVGKKSRRKNRKKK